MPGKSTTDQAIGLANKLATGRADRFTIVREEIAATAYEGHGAPGHAVQET
jgi:hypothetical protein